MVSSGDDSGKFFDEKCEYVFWCELGCVILVGGKLIIFWLLVVEVL